MSWPLYAGLAAATVAVIAITGFALWLGMRSARREGAADASREAARTVADNARTASGVRSDVARAGGADLRERLRRWTRD